MPLSLLRLPTTRELKNVVNFWWNLDGKKIQALNQNTFVFIDKNNNTFVSGEINSFVPFVLGFRYFKLRIEIR